MNEEDDEKRRRGGQTLHTPEIAARILTEMAKGTPLNVICARIPGMPKPRTVRDWKKTVPGFAADFAHAREAGFDELASRALEEAFNESNDWILTKKGPIVSETAIARSRLIVDTILRLLSKWDYARYGDKLMVQGEIHHSGDDSGEGMRAKLKRSPALRAAVRQMLDEIEAEAETPALPDAENPPPFS